MVHIIPITALDHNLAAGAHEALPPFDTAQCGRHRCDAHAVAIHDNLVTARCSLWWNSTPSLPDERVGVIGHYSDASSSAARELLDAACAELKSRGCTIAVGPMDGNTWRRYRFITERGDRSSFFLEPDNGDSWPLHWVGSGFTSLARYFSGWVDDLSVEDPQVSRAGERLQSRGLALRPLDAAHFERELELIYEISTRSFTDNFLYTPVTRAEFIAQYIAIQKYVRPELVLIAEFGSEPVGYVFAVPNQAQTPVDTVIVKTVAVIPDRRSAGAGVWMVQEAHRAGRALGFRHGIHALMHESNNSLNISARFGKPFRRYTLFSRRLA